MSDALRCDRCRNFYDRHDKDEEKRISSYRGGKIYGMALLGSNSIRLKGFDLCPECVKALDNFMNHPDKEE